MNPGYLKQEIIKMSVLLLFAQIPGCLVADSASASPQYLLF